MNGSSLWHHVHLVVTQVMKLFVANQEITILFSLTLRFSSQFIHLDHERTIMLSQGCDHNPFCNLSSPSNRSCFIIQNIYIYCNCFGSHSHFLCICVCVVQAAAKLCVSRTVSVYGFCWPDVGQFPSAKQDVRLLCSLLKRLCGRDPQSPLLCVYVLCAYYLSSF